MFIFLNFLVISLIYSTPLMLKTYNSISLFNHTHVLLKQWWISLNTSGLFLTTYNFGSFLICLAFFGGFLELLEEFIIF